MDFDLNDDQQAILDAVATLLAEHAGAARAIALQPKGEYDGALDSALKEAGFSEVGRPAAGTGSVSQQARAGAGRDGCRRKGN